MKRSLTARLSLLIVCLLIVAQVHGGVLVIAYMDESKVALVDGKTFKTIVLLDSGKNPHEVRISPDKRRAYVAAGRTITVIDIRKRTVRANFNLDDYSAHDIRVSRDGRRIWAACAQKESILEIDAETGMILKIYKTNQKGSWFVEVTPDERKLYTPNLEGKSVSVITRSTGETKVISFEHPVYGIDITRDGKQVWVTGRDINVIDTETDKTMSTIKTPQSDTGRIRITSDGKKAVVALAKTVAVYDVKSRRLAKEIALDVAPKVLTISADNRRAFLTNPGGNSVSVVDMISGKKPSTFDTGRKPDGIAWAD